MSYFRTYPGPTSTPGEPPSVGYFLLVMTFALLTTMGVMVVMDFANRPDQITSIGLQKRSPIA